LDNADEYLKIPMFGFTESFNISVSAAIILYQVISKLKTSNSIHWQLTANERDDLMLDWLKTSIRNSKGIISKYYIENASL